jgi:hypothetical protein
VFHKSKVMRQRTWSLQGCSDRRAELRRLRHSVLVGSSLHWWDLSDAMYDRATALRQRSWNLQGRSDRRPELRSLWHSVLVGSSLHRGNLSDAMHDRTTALWNQLRGYRLRFATLWDLQYGGE